MFKPLLGRTWSRGRCWAAIRLSHRPEPSGHAVHGEVDGLDIGGQHGRRFVLLRHTHMPQRLSLKIFTGLLPDASTRTYLFLVKVFSSPEISWIFPNNVKSRKNSKTSTFHGSSTIFRNFTGLISLLSLPCVSFFCIFLHIIFILPINHRRH